MSEKTCVIHCVSGAETEEISCFTDIRWKTVLQCCEQWVNLDGCERERAQLLTQKPERSDGDGYHDACYKAFTHKVRIAQAEKRVAKGKLVRKPSPVRKVLRKREDRRPSNILPPVCIICRKEKWVKRKGTGTRTRETLLQGGSEGHGFLEAASLLHREDILRDLNYKDDLLAVEAKYHASCYKQFMMSAVAFFPSPRSRDHNSSRIIDPADIVSSSECDSSSDVESDKGSSGDEEVEGVEDTMSARCTTTEDSHELRNVFMASLAVRNAVKQAPPFKPSTWPPPAEEMTEERIVSLVPPVLFNMLAWICGLSSEPQVDQVDVEPEARRRILSIAQDILFLANPCCTPPKHFMLSIISMAVRHITGSKRVIDILNGLGHSASHSTVQRLETDMAEFQLLQPVPATLRQNTFTTLVWDNIDFVEETTNGMNTTHCVNGIAIQTQTEERERNNGNTVPVTITRKRRRSLQVTPEAIPIFTKQRRIDPDLPQASGTDAEYRELENDKLEDGAFFLLKTKLNEGEPVQLTWAGYHTVLQQHVPPLSTITYLPVIDASATEWSTVNEILKRSVQIAESLNLHEVVIVADQAIYSKAQQLRWGNADFIQHLVLRMGEFHTLMAFLGAIGKRFQQSVLEAILTECGTVASGSMKGVLSGRHYNRALRAHKQLAEALACLRLEAFLQQQEPDTQESYKETFDLLAEHWSEGKFTDAVFSAECTRLLRDFSHYNAERSQLHPTYAFWSSYLDMVQLMLLFLRASREGNWSLHLAAVHRMLPWFFALDRVNYARYMSIYYREMVALPATHPSTHAHLLDGQFSVQRQSSYGFAKVACDQTIEQTINREAKSKAGWKGFSLRKNAVCRWVMSSHARGRMTEQCENLAGHSREEMPTRKDMEPGEVRKHEEMVAAVKTYIREHINPFTVESLNLINISSGVVASGDVARHLSSAMQTGETQYRKFVEDRFVKKEQSVFATLKSLKLKTFAENTVKSSSESSEKRTTLIATNKLLSRLLTISQREQVDLKDVVRYALAEIPPALGNGDGSMTKTNK
ncbi:hypothetical protein BaRGS_00036789 [Batillaria attramentaria]|uniref:Uncharacterized protein n=1 Tax=Batillaria attramentaria TaxID=370345 RepID=A0ABD0JAZ4_9CAEN